MHTQLPSRPASQTTASTLVPLSSLTEHRTSASPAAQSALPTAVTCKTSPYDSETVRREMVKEFYATREPGLIGTVVSSRVNGAKVFQGDGFTVQRSNVLWIRKLARHMVWPVELGG